MPLPRPSIPLPGRERRRKISGWGRLARVEATIDRPAHVADVEAVVRRSGDPMIARGLGRAYGDAAQVEDGRVLETSALDALGPVDASASTIDVAAGVSLSTLMERLVPEGWMLPVIPGTSQVTVGGAIASDVHGKNHHRDGGFGAYLDNFALVLADGSTQVVSRETDRPLFDATVGGMGLTGIVTSARIRLTPAPSDYARVQTEKARTLDALLERMTERDADAPYSVAWLDLSSPKRHGRGIMQFGEVAQRDWLPAKQRNAPQTFEASRRIVVPPLPGSVVTERTVRMFNQAEWLRQRPGEHLVPLSKFFFPLDRLGGWNRLYGQAGFLQYQFVLPLGAEALLRAIAQRFADGPVVPALVVLKRLGAAGDGMLSFPLAGWTLAVDLPAEDARIFLMLDEMDEAVATAGGRVYLAKDARLRPDVLAQMYPRIEEWRAVKTNVDPQGRFRSDLSRRLGLDPQT